MVTNACAWIRSSFILDSCLIPCETPCYSLSILCSSRQRCKRWWLHCGASRVGGLWGTGLFKWHQLDLLLRETRNQHADIKLASKECWNGPSELLLMGKGSRPNRDVYGKDNQPKVVSMSSCSSSSPNRRNVSLYCVRFAAGCVLPGHTWNVCQDSAGEVAFPAGLQIAIAPTDFAGKIISCALPFAKWTCPLWWLANLGWAVISRRGSLSQQGTGVCGLQVDEHPFASRGLNSEVWAICIVPGVRLCWQPFHACLPWTAAALLSRDVVTCWLQAWGCCGLRPEPRAYRAPMLCLYWSFQSHLSRGKKVPSSPPRAPVDISVAEFSPLSDTSGSKKKERKGKNTQIGKSKHIVKCTGKKVFKLVVCLTSHTPVSGT